MVETEEDVTGIQPVCQLCRKVQGILTSQSSGRGKRGRNLH